MDLELGGVLKGNALEVARGTEGLGGEGRVHEEDLARRRDAADDLVDDLRLRLRGSELLDDRDLAGGGAVKELAAEGESLPTDWNP